MGYNGGVLDLKPHVVSTTTFQKDDDEKIEHIMKNKLMTSAGGLYKSGIFIANCDMLLKASILLAAETER